MEIEELRASLNLLVEQVEHRDDDDHEFWLQLHQTLEGLRAMGMPVPEDLAHLEQDLARRFTSEGSAKVMPDDG